MRSLVSARHKLDRAEHHLEELERAVAAYLEPLHLVTTTADAEFVEYRMAPLPPVPDALSVTFGDFLQNARATLEHAAYAFSTEVRPDFRHTGFPIVLEQERWSVEADRLIPHVPDAARQVIRNFQPFAWGAREYDLLLSLHRLARVDRHRTVTLLAAVVAITGVGWARRVPKDEPPEMSFYPPAVRPGDLVLRLPSVGREPTAQFEPRFAGRVVIGEPDRLAEMLEVDDHARSIHDRIGSVLAYLAQL